MAESRRILNATAKLSMVERKLIQGSRVLKKLIEHVETADGTMNNSQVTVALGLLKKVMPDLQATTLSGDADGSPIKVEVSSKEQRDAAVAAALSADD